MQFSLCLLYCSLFNVGDGKFGIMIFRCHKGVTSTQSPSFRKRVGLAHVINYQEFFVCNHFWYKMSFIIPEK